MPSQPPPERPTLREIFRALLHVTVTTADGVIYFSGVVTATWVVYMWGNPGWIVIAAIYGYLAVVLARYPWLAVLYGVVVLPVATIMELFKNKPGPWGTWAGFAVVCLLALVLALGVRMVVAIAWQTLRVVFALTKWIAVYGLVISVLLAVTGPPLAVPLAALTLGGLASAFWFAIFASLALRGMASILDERADRFINSITLPAFDWNRTPIGRLEAHALKRREQRARESPITNH